MSSLWNIEGELADLMEAREAALVSIDAACVDLNSPIQPFKDATAHLAEIDLAIAEAVKAETRKVDGVCSYWRDREMRIAAAKAEKVRIDGLIKTWQRQLDVLKSAVQLTMEEMEWRAGKPRKLEGKTGSLSLKGNGGKQPVVIADETLIPEEYKTVTCKMDAALWQRICKALPDLQGMRECWKEPNLTAIAAALDKPCQRCKGRRFVTVPDTWLKGNTEDVQCSACGGSGKQGVPGALLAPRGQHVECK